MNESKNINIEFFQNVLESSYFLSILVEHDVTEDTCC